PDPMRVRPTTIPPDRAPGCKPKPNADGHRERACRSTNPPSVRDRSDPKYHVRPFVDAPDSNDTWPHRSPGTPLPSFHHSNTARPPYTRFEAEASAHQPAQPPPPTRTPPPRPAAKALPKSACSSSSPPHSGRCIQRSHPRAP